MNWEHIVSTSIPALLFANVKSDRSGWVYAALTILVFALSHWASIVHAFHKVVHFRRPCIRMSGSITSDRMGSRKAFSKRMLSVLHYVERRAKTLGINEMTEVFADDCMVGMGDKRDGLDALVMNQQVPLTLSSKNGNVTCCFSVTREGRQDSSFDRFVQKVRIDGSLQGDTMRSVLDFIAECERQFDDFHSDQLRQQLFCFTLTGVSNGKGVFAKRPFQTNKTFDNLFFDRKEDVLRCLRAFEDVDKYRKFGIPHTLGFLLSGNFGLGKTACAKAIANYTRRHVIVVPLHRVTKMSVLTDLFFSETIDSIKIPFESRLYVFEEIDCNGWQELVANRATKGPTRDDTANRSHETSENQVKNVLRSILNEGDSTDAKDSVTLGGLLELLDGMSETPGRMMVLTTNYPEVLDPALMRPGRIDLHVRFEPASAKVITDMVHAWYGNVIDDDLASALEAYKLTQAELCRCFMDSPDWDRALHVIKNKAH